MKSFEYTARDEFGTKKVGLQRFDSEQHILVWLGEQGLTPISVTPLAADKNKSRIAGWRKKIKAENMASFCWQLDTMLQGGVSFVDALDIIAEDIQNPLLGETVCQISERIKGGEAFSDCLPDYPKVFNSLFCAIIRAGETSGSLPAALQRMVKYYEDHDRMIRKVKAAMSYPAFIVAFVILITFAMMIFIVPRFQTFFKQAKGEMPALTKGLMQVYELMVSYGPYALLGLTAVVVALVAYCRTPKGHERLSKILLAMPFVGNVLKQLFISLFCKTISIMLSAGVSVVDGFDILAGVTTNNKIKMAIISTKERIIEGASISLSMSASEFFPNMVSKMTQVGEESGSLPAVLDKLGDYYETKTDAAISTFTRFLEPLMIVIAGSIVLIIVMALYLPIFTFSR